MSVNNNSERFASYIDYVLYNYADFRVWTVFKTKYLILELSLIEIFKMYTYYNVL